MSSKNLFRKTTPGFILTSIVNLTLSIILVQKIGVLGALIGTVVAFYGCDFISKTYFVIKYGIEGKLKSFVKIYGFMILGFLLNIWILKHFYLYDAVTLGSFLFKMIQTTSLSGILFFLLYYCVFYEFRDVVKTAVALVKSGWHKVVKQHG